jgi:hypothetical protein
MNASVCVSGNSIGDTPYAPLLFRSQARGVLSQKAGQFLFGAKQSSLAFNLIRANPSGNLTDLISA